MKNKLVAALFISLHPLFAAAYNHTTSLGMFYHLQILIIDLVCASEKMRCAVQRELAIQLTGNTFAIPNGSIKEQQFSPPIYLPASICT